MNAQAPVEQRRALSQNAQSASCQLQQQAYTSAQPRMIDFAEGRDRARQTANVGPHWRLHGAGSDWPCSLVPHQASAEVCNVDIAYRLERDASGEPQARVRRFVLRRAAR